MAKTQTYPMEKILAAREALRQLPVKEREKSKAEVVEFLKADLRKAVKQGHSLKEIQAMLAEQGVSVPLSRMETVLGQSGKEKVRKKDKTKQELEGMTQGNGVVSAPTIRAHSSPSFPKSQKEKAQAETPKEKTEIQKTTPAWGTKKEPSCYTPDISDSEL